MELGAILTAIVTPFDDEQRVDEEAFVSLMQHLANHGTEGFVVCGTTGEAPTLTDDEHLGLIELAVREHPEGTTVVAGVGSNDTRHAVHMTARACELGADALLSVNPYYNRPGRRGIVAHYREISAATDRPVLLYNIPQRTGEDLPNDLLAELAQIDHIEGVKQANNESLALVDGLEVYAGNDDVLARTLDIGGAGGILTGSHFAGLEMRRMVDEPENRAEIERSLQELFAALAIGPQVVTIKAGLNLQGHRVGIPRLPLVEATADETETVRAALVHHGLLETAGA